MKEVIISSIILLSLLACSGETIVSEIYQFENDQWLADDKKSFEFVVDDTSTVYQMDLALGHTEMYGFQNLYVKIHTEYPSGKTASTSTSLELINTDGSWAGECNGNACTINLPLQKQFRFPEKGKYRWAIEHFMRIDTVEGIKNIEVVCRKVSAK